jgi:nicotianamine synthase
MQTSTGQYPLQSVKVTSDRIIAIYSELKNSRSLRPTPRINALFSELVALTSSSSDEITAALIAEPQIQRIMPDLRLICSTGESYLEEHWASKISSSPYPKRALQQFPYYDNYLKLMEFEYKSLSLLAHHTLGRVLFIGSGPLPLSPILLASQYDLSIDALDFDQSAVTLSRNLVQSLDLTAILHIEQGDAQTYSRYSEYDAIFLAALVGAEANQKHSIIETIYEQMQPGSLLLIRTVDDQRALLYPKVDIDNLRDFNPKLVVQPLSDILNSIIVIEKPKLAKH